MAAPLNSTTIEQMIGGLPGVSTFGLNTNQSVNFSGLLVDTSGVITGGKNATFGAVTVTSLINSGTSVGSKANTIDQTTATVTLTVAQSGSVILLDKTDGIVVTLPAPAVGLNYRFLNVVDQASGNNDIVTDAGTTFVQGGINVCVVNSATSKIFVGNGSSHVKIRTNGGTTGGLAGGSIEVRCISTTKWSIDGQLVGSSTIATPFST